MIAAMHRSAAILAVLCAAATALGIDEAELRRDGAFGFPQKDASVLCDTPALRVSEWNDAENVYVQAIVFADGDGALGQTEDGRDIGDNSSLVLDVDGNDETTPKVDRTYSLNPWPARPGLNYSIQLGGGSSTGLQADSKGRGAISYVAVDAAKKVRVDCFLIPLAEIGRKPGDTIRFGYWADSPTPKLTLNSIGYKSTKRYFPHQLPLKDFHEVKLADRPTTLDARLVPEGRGTIAVAAKPNKPMPKLGAVPPEVVATAWLNWKDEKPPSLASLKGKVVVIEFWATWCGPCVGGVPHLNEVFDAHSNEGLVVLSVTDQKNKGYIEDFLKKTPMHYTVGVGSEAVGEYGVRGIPHAFIIAKDGTVAWSGAPSDNDFELTIKMQLAATPAPATPDEKK